MDTKINKDSVSSWALDIYSVNDQAITNLNEFETLANSITDAYNSLSAKGFTDKLSKDIENIIDNHTTMGNLQAFLEKVVESAENI